MKKILGLDLGTNSIGWAHVYEGNSLDESIIKQIGVRVNPLTVDEQTNFEKGKPITTNAERTLKRSARKNLSRYKLRRKNLINTLLTAGIINEHTILAEEGKGSTFKTWELRSAAAESKIALDDLAKVFFAINKKRGYKSSRKAKNEEDGKIVDGMSIAKQLYDEGITPGQLVFQRLKANKKTIPDFYRSDLKNELSRIWTFQQPFHKDILTNEFFNEIADKGQKATSAIFYKKYGFNIAEIKEIDDDLKNISTINFNQRDFKKVQAYKWRVQALSEKLPKEQLAYVITHINNDINNSSGYLGAISDRSKELFFNQLTIGQYLYKQLKDNAHTSLKNQVFYRQDYLDEFEKIWTTQSKYHHVLTENLKSEIRDIIIFYQRKLKSQTKLISYCELAANEITINGKTQIIGPKVTPRSSPLFQEFKIWQNLGSLTFKRANSKVKIKRKNNVTDDDELNTFHLSKEDKEVLFEELNVKGTLDIKTIYKILNLKPAEWEANFKFIEGNTTNAALFNAYLKILEVEGYNEELLKLADSDEINISKIETSAGEIKEMIKIIFNAIGINTQILDFNAELHGQELEKQPAFQLWHLLYSTEDDNLNSSAADISLYGNDNINLKKKLCLKFGFKPEHAKILTNIVFQNDYASLSAKAIRKLYPHIKESNYSTACTLAGYRHSKNSLTKDEIQRRTLQPKLTPIKKNSLRNPVVEKILNQMINIVNELIEKNSERDANGNIVKYYQFDEIRIELARELKKNAKERQELTSQINSATILHEKIAQLLRKEFGVLNPTRNDIIKYKLYEELRNNGYKDLYTDTYIPREKLFTKEIDIEHIIPQSRLFDDSFSNKTIVYRNDNLAKGNKTAIDYIESKYGESALEDYLNRIENLYKLGLKNKDDGISKSKFLKLTKRGEDIGDGFIARDLRDTQYIAKMAKNILFQISRSVLSTTGSITDRLREDWGLVNIMKELNLPKYRAVGLVTFEERKYGQKVEVIKDWTKRNDHRHHAMDALTVAFTKHSHIQYLNYLNARKDESHKLHSNILAIEEKETEIQIDENGNKRRVFKLPINNFRQVAKDHLESILVSHKAKNKVVTKNKNKIKVKGKTVIQETLTPRGQLHKETVYGTYKYYQSKEEKISTKFDLITIQKVTNPKYRKLLAERLKAFDNDPVKAFGGKNSLSKNPIYLDNNKQQVLPDKVLLNWLETDYSIRKDINPDNFKDLKSIEKVIDKRIQVILKNRLESFNGDAKKAFSDLENNPIWINKEKGILAKRVAISGVSNADPLHYKKNHLGQHVLDSAGKKIPVDFISTGNNHHVAIYKDEKGVLQENVISFFEAVERVNQGLPVIDKQFNSHLGWQFLFTMKQNEMFVFPNPKTGFNPHDIDLLDPKNKKLISPNLFRVQSISIIKYGNNIIRDFKFRHHHESMLIDLKLLHGHTYKQIKSLANINSLIKIRINSVGDIVKVGED